MKLFSFYINSCLLSEEGYYPFGMTMSAISSTAGTVAKNIYKFNAGTELTESFDINYYETYFRQYDAQLGRFTGVDSKAEITRWFTPYQFGSNNPITFNDPLGDLTTEELYKVINKLWNSPHGGQWSASDPNTIYYYADEGTAVLFGGLASTGSPFDFQSAFGRGGAGGSSTGAWQVQNSWNSSFINNYRVFVSRIYEAYYALSGQNFTCEDLAVHLLMYFASANNLPLSIGNGSNPDGYKPEDFSSFNDYYEKVATTTGARDLAAYGNTVQLAGYGSAFVGDLILLVGANGIIHHTQIINNITESGIYIMQGNFKPHWWQQLYSLSENPWNPGYRGTAVQSGYYSRESGNFYNLTLNTYRERLLFQNTTSFYRWNFYGFNQ